MAARHRPAPAHPPVPKGELRDGFKFRGGRLSLDLSATVAGRLKDSPQDLLQSPADLGRWLWASGLSTQTQESTPEELAQARELREAIYRLALARTRGESFSARDRAILNRWAAEPPPAPQLGPRGILWTGAGVRGQLAAVARDAAELLGGPFAERIRNCSQDGCALLFVDTSRSGQRRWCSMSGCGNKAKVAEFRRRQRADDR
ncbi:CGNR zinc finger domain-containing protein [Myxococcus qinghaiensis]|uniref:CGNR zinc finger domain-containing protein n=1 Tax=Myxococcus qinghaiensis TaxID=2906758 RepID=UPI0020A74AF7|nr:ABATE domain-containing protein [Myxococcus qinghaiensis]MCP3162888.1 ABATE domain-containing protein [Myxococcus qinghaiensis]